MSFQEQCGNLCVSFQLRFSGSLNADRIANTSRISDFSAEKAKVADCLAERDESQLLRRWRMADTALPDSEPVTDERATTNGSGEQ